MALRLPLAPRITAWLTACAAVCLLVLLAGCGPATPSSRGSASSLGQGSGGTSTAPGGLTYVALGASDAFGVGTFDPNDDSWPAVLAVDLGRPVHLINLGIPGATAAQAVHEQLPIAIDARPDIVTVWLAVNDLADGVSLDDYATQLSALLAQLHARTHARIYVGNLPDLALLPYFANQDPLALRTRIGVWNVRITAICTEAGAHLVDLGGYSAQLAQNPQYISRDGLHPSTIGAAALAQVFAHVIRQTSTA